MWCKTMRDCLGRNLFRVRATGAAALLASLVVTTPAQAQQNIERVLAGIRLNTSAKSVLSKFGNPTQIVVGDVGTRLPGNRAQGTAAGQPGGGGIEGSPGAPGVSPFPVSPGGLPPLGNSFGSPFGGAPVPPPEGEGGGAVAPGGNTQYGNTLSTLARNQEVTWIYDRPGGTSYEFLIGPDGRVIQIKAIGYGNRGPNVRTAKGAGLGTPYVTVVQRYGYPEEHQQVGPILVASYRNRAHASFQFLNNRCIAVTIASTE